MMSPVQEFTVLFPFGGLGSGARGFLDAALALDNDRDQPFLGEGKFRSLGGIDFDKTACIDFEMLTGTPSWHIDIRTITPAMLRARYGTKAPDVIFSSPPCQGASRLLSNKKSKEQKYEDLNQLALTFTDTMLEAWSDAPPKLYLIENVPGLPTRAAGMLKKLRKRLRAAGYVIHTSTHDCGEIGGLAQHRKRFLLVARHAASCQPLLYQPPIKRVRGVGEVLGLIPMPATHAAGAWGNLHTMPRLSWRNWLRLANIPAGGDWRDLANVLQGRARREVFRRHAVQKWQDPHPAVTGPGGHSVEAVADERVGFPEHTAWNGGSMGVMDWTTPSGTVTGGAHPSHGVRSVADPRIELGCEPRSGAYGVTDWEDPSATIVGAGNVDNRPVSVADPRVGLECTPHPGAYGVTDWDDPARVVAASGTVRNRPVSVADPRIAMGQDGLHQNKHSVLNWTDPSHTVIGQPQPSSGAPAVADPRIAVDKPGWGGGAFGVTPWEEPSGTVAGDTMPSNGRYSVADLRVKRAFDAGYGVTDWADPARTVAATNAVGCGAYAVADPRTGWLDDVRIMTLDEAMALDLDPSKPPPFLPLIIAEDGTWHRPMTLLELAALQGFPMMVDGKPLALSGTRTAIATHIGNAVPVGAARAIAERMLFTLLHSASGTWSLGGSDTPVWVEPATTAMMDGSFIHASVC